MAMTRADALKLAAQMLPVETDSFAYYGASKAPADIADRRLFFATHSIMVGELAEEIMKAENARDERIAAKRQRVNLHLETLERRSLAFSSALTHFPKQYPGRMSTRKAVECIRGIAQGILKREETK